MKSIRCRLDCATWCEYFKSGECTSSVKCKYQTEHISVNFPETIFMPSKEAWEKMQAENSRLTAENKRLREEVDNLSHENDELEYKAEWFEAATAELKKRLDKAVELPCKVGDTIYQTDTNGTRIFKSTVKNIIFETDGVAFDERAIGESIFLTEEAVKEKMKELNGGER